MTDTRPPDPPSPFVEQWVRTLSAGAPVPLRALDVAMGRGRHASVLANAGLRVFGVDIQYTAVRDAMSALASRGHQVRGWCADLTVSRLPARQFDLIVVTRFLQRDLFPSLIDALVPGGVILYETFTEGQLAHGRGPTSPEHLLRLGELPAYFGRLDLLFYEETTEPDALARLAARAPRRRS
jgi:tellurite methyltransferase